MCLSGVHSWIELHPPPQWAHVTIKRSYLGLELHLKTASQTTCPKGWNLILICVGETKWATSKPYPSDSTQILSFVVMSLSQGGSRVGKTLHSTVSEYSMSYLYGFKSSTRVWKNPTWTWIRNNHLKPHDYSTISCFFSLDLIPLCLIFISCTVSGYGT